MFCDIPSRASGAKLRHSEEMVLIVSGILVKDRSGRITSICYAIEPSHLPCSIYSHQQGIRRSVLPFKSVWYHPLDFDGLNGFLHRFRVSRPAVPSFPKISAKKCIFLRPQPDALVSVRIPRDVRYHEDIIQVRCGNLFWA